MEAIPETVREQIESLVNTVIPVILASIALACLSTKTRVRFIIGSAVFGSLAGVGVGFFTDSTAAISIAATIGVLTAPATIAKLSGMDLFQAVDAIRKAKEGDAPPSP